jgi:opacity protein-like surface antigen
MAEGRPAKIVSLLVASALALSCPLWAADAVQVSGFADVRGATTAQNPLDGDNASAQIQAGLDWSPSPYFLAHLHLLARTDDGHSQRGHAGTPEAYVEAHLPAGESRFKLRAGAFFLPTSRENVDALWENPYAISSSALNSWFGEELRPIGLDLSWLRGGLTLGATVFRGSDTFGALPVDPGWSLNDRWTLLGQKVPAGQDFASVSAENDHRLGWSARAGWSSRQLSVLFTHIDNRGDGLPYGDLYNWKTRFDVVGFDYRRGDWTLAGETGWGPTELFFPGGSFEADLRASYLLLSRRRGRARATARFDAFSNGATHKHALTLAAFWTPVPKLSLAIELAAGGGERRGLADLRYRFAGP